MIEIIIGFVLGIFASVIAGLVYEYATRPLVKCFIDKSGRAQGQALGQPPHEFFHLVVRNLPARWPIPGRKPAWSCKVTIEVFNSDGSPAIQNSITGRWTSQPEPLLPIINAGQPANIIDPAKIVAARKIDVHQHENQQISLAVKFEGELECYIFSNESYLFQKWQNPAWRLGIGTYRVRINTYYERGRTQDDFELCNSGSSRDNIHLKPWSKY